MYQRLLLSARDLQLLIGARDLLLLIISTNKCYTYLILNKFVVSFGFSDFQIIVVTKFDIYVTYFKIYILISVAVYDNLYLVLLVNVLYKCVSKGKRNECEHCNLEQVFDKIKAVNGLHFL